jgi:serine phosphatase RsbU (regulator of sigma subunit)
MRFARRSTLGSNEVATTLLEPKSASWGREAPFHVIGNSLEPTRSVRYRRYKGLFNTGMGKSSMAIVVRRQWDAFCADMIIPAVPIGPDHLCGNAFDILNANPDWPGLAVIDGERQVQGYLSRNKLLSILSKPLMADLYGRRVVTLLMETEPLVVDIADTLDRACERINFERPEALIDGFIIADGGRYAGLGGMKPILAQTVEQARRRAECLAHEKEEVERANGYITESIRYASRIQTSLLPEATRLDGLVADIAITWQPRDVVGGDFYWTGRFGEIGLIAIMDCTGHGVPGAFMTAIAVSQLDRVLHEYCHDDPAVILGLLNRMVKTTLRQSEEDRATNWGSDDGLDASICIIDHAKRQLTFAGANLPLLFTKGGRIEEIGGDRHSLGYRSSRSDFRFTNHVVPFEPGQAFYLVTDGVTDQIGGPNGRLYGRRRLMAALEGGLDLPMQGQMDRILDILAEYRGAETRRDDQTFFGFLPLAAESR